MFPTLIRQVVASVRPAIPTPAFLASFPTRKTWPPDFKRLTPQEQLRFEKKYKRRVKLASRRPRFDKAVKLAQLTTVVCKLFLVPVLAGETRHHHMSRGPTRR